MRKKKRNLKKSDRTGVIEINCEDLFTKKYESEIPQSVLDLAIYYEHQGMFVHATEAYLTFHMWLNSLSTKVKQQGGPFILGNVWIEELDIFLPEFKRKKKS